MTTPIDVTLTGGSGSELSAVTERIALALMACGAHVECIEPHSPGRDTAVSLRGIPVRVHVAGAPLPPAALHEVLTPSGKTAQYGRIALVVLVLLTLVNAEVRLHFGLRLDTILLAAAAWGVWYWTSGSRRR